jgi:hypothetical protein
MSEDIVDWLRDLGDRAAFEPSAHHKAADEIERLWERRDDWRAAMTENHDLWRENERLRAALEKIMQKCSYARRDKWCACIDCKCIIARAALGEEKTDAQNHVP